MKAKRKNEIKASHAKHEAAGKTGNDTITAVELETGASRAQVFAALGRIDSERPITRRQQAIVESYDFHDDGDISTEQLFARVQDDTEADAGEITDALVAAGRLTQA